jgi:hypothetical protein
MRAFHPIYNNNKEIRYENKIKNNKNHKNDILIMMMINMNVITQR